MDATQRLPPRAPEFHTTTVNQTDLLDWMETHHRNFGPIFQSRAYGTPVYVVSDPKIVEHVLRRNYQNYRKGRAIKRIRMLLGNGLMVSEGDLWKRQRRMIHPAFHERAIGLLTGLIRAESQALLMNWKQAAQVAEPVNVTRDVSLAILKIILKVIFGSDYESVAHHFIILAEKPERSMHFAQDFRALGSLIKTLVTARRSTVGNAPDMLGLLMAARDRDTGEAMSDGQLIDEILTVIVAGHETTASTLNWAWFLLSQHPNAAKKLRAEVAQMTDYRQLVYTQNVLEETMRLYPAGWLMTRQAIDDDMLGDYYLPARTEVFISPYIIQRRPDIWAEPNEFDPDRFARMPDWHSMAYLPFSAGPRNCIGEHLARLEMIIHMTVIARDLRLEYLGDPPQLDLGVNLRSLRDFMMQPHFV